MKKIKRITLKNFHLVCMDCFKKRGVILTDEGLRFSLPNVNGYKYKQGVKIECASCGKIDKIPLKW